VFFVNIYHFSFFKKKKKFQGKEMPNKYLKNEKTINQNHDIYLQLNRVMGIYRTRSWVQIRSFDEPCQKLIGIKKMNKIF